jgi:hypothetical protein
VNGGFAPAGDIVADVLSAILSVGRPFGADKGHFYAKNSQRRVWYNLCFKNKRRVKRHLNTENKYNN